MATRLEGMGLCPRVTDGTRTLLLFHLVEFGQKGVRFFKHLVVQVVQIFEIPRVLFASLLHALAEVFVRFAHLIEPMTFSTSGVSPSPICKGSGLYFRRFV